MFTMLACRMGFAAAVSRVRIRFARFLLKRIELTFSGALLAVAALLSGCDTTGTALGVVATTTALAKTPGNELRQVYYLGVFDPQDQMASAIYRVTVHGQASALSRMRFASGWVPANLIDSLGTAIAYDKDKGVYGVSKSEAEGLQSISSHRRMMMFGPEGVVESPENHRLVIVMGQSPDAWFGAIDSALGEIASATSEQKSSQVLIALLSDLNKIQQARRELELLSKPLEVES